MMTAKFNRSSSMLFVSLALLCVAMAVKAQYNTYDSDANSDSDGNPILTQAELGKLVRNTAKLQAAQSRNNQHHQQLSAATRNLYNRQQPLQYAPSYNKRSNSFGSQSELGNYAPVMGASHGRQAHSHGHEQNNDDDEGPSSGSSNYGPGFGSSFDSNNADSDNEGSNNEGQPMNLNQAASGYPGQGDYHEGGAGLTGFGQGGFNEGSDFGPSGDDFGLDGRRAKSASSPLGSRGYGSDDDAGAPQYGPNSAVNSGGDDDEARSAFASENQGDNNDDDE